MHRQSMHARPKWNLQRYWDISLMLEVHKINKIYDYNNYPFWGLSLLLKLIFLFGLFLCYWLRVILAFLVTGS
jgi:hypothetical protein